jgi:hypothetical protein
MLDCSTHPFLATPVVTVLRRFGASCVWHYDSYKIDHTMGLEHYQTHANGAFGFHMVTCGFATVQEGIPSHGT